MHRSNLKKIVKDQEKLNENNNGNNGSLDREEEQKIEEVEFQEDQQPESKVDREMVDEEELKEARSQLTLLKSKNNLKNTLNKMGDKSPPQLF